VFDHERESKDTYAPARFLRWEIVKPKAEQPNMLTTLGPITLKFAVKINRLIGDGVHGIALRNSDNQLIWAWAVYNLHLGLGIHEFVYTLPSLPLRPGIYSWHVSLYNEGSLLDEWSCTPELIVAALPLTHPRDEWSGILNMPCEFQLRTGERDEEIGI